MDTGLRTSGIALLSLAVLASSGCATQPTPRQTPPAVAAEAAAVPPESGKAFVPPTSLHWFRVSAERRALFAQAYRQATARLPGVDSQEGPWAVVVDADETVLDNMAYQERLARGLPPYEKWSQENWNAWGKEEKALAFTEAVAFLNEVRLRGGLIAIVSNRSETTCKETGSNLVKQKVPYDALLCAKLVNPNSGVDGSVDTNKEPRFQWVHSGGAFKRPTPLRLAVFVGDNIKDCPGQSQTSFTADKFGTECIVLPNPVYGSWDTRPYVPSEGTP